MIVYLHFVQYFEKQHKKYHLCRSNGQCLYYVGIGSASKDFLESKALINQLTNSLLINETNPKPNT